MYPTSILLGMRYNDDDEEYRSMEVLYHGCPEYQLLALEFNRCFNFHVINKKFQLMCNDSFHRQQEGFAFSHCTTCRAQFHLLINFLEGSCWRNTKFRMFVARDVLLGFLAVQMVRKWILISFLICQFNLISVTSLMYSGGTCNQIRCWKITPKKVVWKGNIYNRSKKSWIISCNSCYLFQSPHTKFLGSLFSIFERS